MNAREELGISLLQRTNPTCGFEAGSIETDGEYNEVTLHQADVTQKKKHKDGHHHGHHEHSSAGPQKKTFSFDSVVDDLKLPNKKDKNDKSSTFASQGMMWETFERQMDRRMQDGSSDIGVVAFGIPGSGKTHTLFGGSSKKERGLLPRFVEKSFKQGWTGQEKGGIVKFETVLLSMYVTIGEHLVDVFRINNPLALHTGRNNFAYSDTLGPLALPVDYVCCDSASECNGFISLGLRVAAAVIAGHTEVYSSASTHVRMLLVSQEKDLYKVNFVEAPSNNAPKTAPVHVDRLSGASQLFLGARELYEGVKEAAGNSLDAVAYTKDMLRDNARRTMVQHALQDVIWRHPECIAIACCRGTSAHYADNVKVLELADAIWANQLRPSDAEAEAQAEEKENRGRDRGRGEEGSGLMLGPRHVVPLKEAASALKGEIKACRERIAEIDTAVRDVTVAAAERHAALHGNEGLPLPPLPPPRPRPRSAAAAAEGGAAAAAGAGAGAAAGTGAGAGAAGRAPRRERGVSPQYEYSPPDVPASATGAAREILTLQAEQALLEAKEHYLSRYELVLRLLLMSREDAKAAGSSKGKGKGSQIAAYAVGSDHLYASAGGVGTKGAKYRLNHAPLYVPCFRSAKAPHNYLLHRDCVGDPYDSEEEERAEKVRALGRGDSGSGGGGASGGGGLQYFAQVMQEWLLERGYQVNKVPYDASLDAEASKPAAGGLDLSMFSNARKTQSYDDEDDDDEEEEGQKDSAGAGAGAGAGNGRSKKGSSSSSGSGSGSGQDSSISQSIPWAKSSDPPSPYLVPMSPHSGLQEHYAKLPVPPGRVLVLRGVTGLAVGLQSSLLCRYSSTPIDTDAEKDQVGYLEALGDLMGEGLLPVEEYWEGEEKEREKEEAAARQARALGQDGAGGASVATGGTEEEEEEEDEDDRAMRLEREKEEQEAKRKQEQNRAIVSVVVDGAGIQPLHCFFKCENQKTLTVRPNTIVSSAAAAMAIGAGAGAGAGPYVAVNGKQITDTVPLVDLDAVQVGTRYYLVRIPMKPKRANDPVVIAESLFSLSKWELCLLRSHMAALHRAIEGNLLTRLHLNHAHADRSLLAVLKAPDRGRLNAVPDYAVPAEALEHVYKGISPLDRVYLAEVAACAYVINSYSRAMRRGLVTELALGETSAKDVKYRKLVHVQAPPVDLFTRPVDPHAMQTQVQHAEAVHSGTATAFALLGTVTNTGGRVPLKYRVKDKDRDGATATHQVLSGYLVCSASDGAGAGASASGGQGKFIWNPEVASERLYLLMLMHRTYNAWWCARDPSWLNILYPPALDPTNDAQDDELIGVGYLYLDSFQHLIDVNDVVPLVSVEGSKVGHLKVRGRVWIDKMETSPAYLTVDSEKHIRDFENRLCLLRLYFESLIDLPEKQCSSTYVKFNFFYHSKPYSTLRHGGLSTHPFLHSAVKIEQRITGDFLEYVDRGSLELEVYGKRRKVFGPSVQALSGIAEYRVGEAVPLEEEEQQDEEDEEEDEGETGEDKAAMSEAELMMAALASKLERAEEQLQRSKEHASTVIAEKKDVERKLVALRASLEAEGGDGGAAGKRRGRRGQEEERSSTCVVS